MNSSPTRKAFFITTSLVLAMFFINSCNTKSARLEALEDAASAVQPTTGREISRNAQDEGTTLGKPVYPIITIVYEPTENYTQEDLYKEIIKILKQNNWRTERVKDEYSVFEAPLPQNGFKLFATVIMSSQKNVVRINFENSH